VKHNWDTHPASWPVARLLEHCDVRFQRRSGPGGQHRNKVETGVVIVFRPADVRAEATERRGREANRTTAIARLRRRLAVRVRSASLAAAAPSPLWCSRLVSGRVSVSPRHADFPALLAEALDVLKHFDWHTGLAAVALKCSATQLVRFIQREPEALAYVNDRRRERGLAALR
jgi:hypothetical protein